MCDVCGSKLKSTYARIQRRHNRTVVQYIEKRNTFNTLIIAHWYVCKERRWWRRRRRNNTMNNEYVSSIGSADTQIKSHLKKNPQKELQSMCNYIIKCCVCVDLTEGKTTAKKSTRKTASANQEFRVFLTNMWITHIKYAERKHLDVELRIAKTERSKSDTIWMHFRPNSVVLTGIQHSYAKQMCWPKRKNWMQRKNNS